ncbi:MAG: helix-turn-helix transcriptional regulator [Proteobacteria bacterium]|nr:helix-turn-helix transcriptional regulator [Pseudomonadota bacterium]
MYEAFLNLNQKNLAQILKGHRKKAHISQQMLADMAGVSRTAIQRLEESVLKVQLDTLLKVMNILNITLELSSPLLEEFKDE